ncbi:uncharacterized protein LOC130980631 [Arachis stenosperma]|uniref:uncharacterized protein LOC130980631 n=1 Tax=Arachis stenosperma TaxID=217475 RepID=UPI0025ABA274|nr:uncharacterized protein LOC130980631 [Arachis stenosperma]
MNSRVRREALERIVGEGYRNCIWELRMNTNAFANLCELLQVQGGLTEDGHVSLPEQAVIRIQSILFAKATLVEEDCGDPTWRKFKGCLGALDGIYIEVTVPESEKARYRTRKGKICTNVLGVCNREMGFVYVLSGWEGSASDSRVLRDAITRRNSLKIPHGNYYLVDAGYTNGPGFLAPYRGTRYHVREWAQGARAPRNYQEYFNRVHSSARNIIERCFGLLKKRLSILRSPSFYPLKTQSQIIIACCLLQNFIRKSMEMDSDEEGSILDEFMPDGDEEQDGMIDVVNMENKLIWSDEETNAFVGFMEEFVADGQRADCGQFKPRTFEKLALKMLEAFPGCTLTAKHCKNKHKRLKEKYQYAADMLACSGFGWNHDKQCVEVDSKDVLDAWLKAHPTKFYSPGKPFSLFHRMEGIFGRDRATGAAAVSGFDAEEQVNEETEDTAVGFDESDMSPYPDNGGGPAIKDKHHNLKQVRV